MEIGRSLSSFAGLSLLSIAQAACSRPSVAPPTESYVAPSSSAATQSSSPAGAARAPEIESDDFALPLPRGYVDRSAVFRKKAPRLLVVLEASESSHGYQPTIVVQKAPLPGGSFADPSTCLQTGKGLVTGGTEAPGTGGTLSSATIVDGPLGKTCQIELHAPEGVALITELHEPGNTPLTPKALWLLTCNYGEGDAAAEAACRSALAGFRLRSR
jgi:hypothetical protein